jgi:chemotaxis signal transduction protein
MNDELAEFIDSGAHQAVAADLETTVVRDLLVFRYLDDLYGIPAACVEGVIPWKAPVPIPGADRRVQGVIQDRGRIVVLMAHPTGRSDREASPESKRIVICATPRGNVGLPATSTNAVGPVELAVEPTPFALHDSRLGPFTYLDPTMYVEPR